MNYKDLIFSKDTTLDSFSSMGILVLRIYFGLTICFAGFDKLPLPEWMVEQVASLHFPFPVFFAWIATFVEFGGGLLVVFGLLTRPAAFLLAFTMGMAAFGYQQSVPLMEINVPQMFFWAFLCLSFTGTGKFGLDSIVSPKLASGIFAGVLIFGLGLQFFGTSHVNTSSEPDITSVHIPGSFNDWDVTSNEMDTKGDGIYTKIITLQQGGPVEFKFAANKNWKLSLGDDEQENKNLPLQDIGDLNSNENIKLNIPIQGQYKFEVNINDYSYKVTALKSNE